jgi:hypothetical protein
VNTVCPFFIFGNSVKNFSRNAGWNMEVILQFVHVHFSLPGSLLVFVHLMPSNGDQASIDGTKACDDSSQVPKDEAAKHT